jgi:hypothetical protein
MNKKITSLALTAALIGCGLVCQADSANATGNDNDPMRHPVNAYNNHEVKSDMKDSQQNSQKADEAKAAYKQAKSDYDKSLKENGANSSVTKDAKKRMMDAHKDMQKYRQKAADANRDLKKDESKAQQ